MKLHDYQEYSKQFIIDHPAAGLLIDMGMGKTVSTLSAINDLKYDYCEIDNVLVIAPLKVASKTWPDEIEKWDHLNHLSYSKVLGSEKKRLEALRVKADVYLINRENVVWLVEHYGRKWPFKTVVIDELSSFKDQSSKRFKALRKVRPLITRIIGLTGTPAPNSLINLWSQIYLLDRGERLEPKVGQYRQKYFTPGQTQGYTVFSWNLRPGSSDIIYGKIGDICVSMKAKDYLTLPERIDNTIWIDLSKKEMDQYKELEKELILSVADADIVAANAAVLSGKLLQMANGAVYDDEGGTQYIHDGKMEAVADILEESQGEPILLFYNFKHDLKRLKKKFPFARTLDTDKDTDDWNRGEIPLLLAHPQSAGHGLNLQHGGHIVVWFSLTWSLEHYQQANARLDRQGQKESVIIHHLVAKGTMDEKVIKALEGKRQGQDALLEAVKAKIKEVQDENSK